MLCRPAGSSRKASKTDRKQLERDKDPKLLQKCIFVISTRFYDYVSDMKEEHEISHVVYADRENVPGMKAANAALKLHSICGSREGRVKARLDGTET
jgi:hypothetical protein